MVVPETALPHSESVFAGIVSEWYDEAGWGVIRSSQTPGGCWTHFSAIRVLGYRAPTSGAKVWFVFESAQQDGYQYRAVNVWPPGVAFGSPDPIVPTPQQDAYRSALAVTYDEDASEASRSE